MKKFTRFTIRLKTWNEGKLTLDMLRYKKSRILAAAQVNKFSEAYLRVQYRGGGHNDAYCFTFSEIKRVLTLFTERATVDFIVEGADRRLDGN